MVESRLPDALDIRDVGAGYGGRRVVDGVSFAVARGDVLALLGGNGSGKSTLLKAITGRIRLMAGAVAIDGVDLAARPEAAKAGFGLAIDPAELPMNLTGRQYLELVASIRRCAPNAWPCGDVVDRLDFGRWLDQPIVAYSLGTRAKTSIAAALLGAPPLLIFDETLNGLDPLAAWEAKAIVRELAASGRHGFVVATHSAEGVPLLCDRAVFIAEGRLLRSWDTPALGEAAAQPGGFEAAVVALLRGMSRRAA
jgi:ABC-2 type transport system ATP-binding protein